MAVIYIDGDACPVKAEVERVATRHDLVVYLVSNGGLRPSSNPNFRHIIVPEGADAADDWIAERVASDDIVITADIPLAARCLERQALVLGPSGKPFTRDNIGMALGMRDLQAHMREETAGAQTYNRSFTKKDRSRFLGMLENTVQATLRSQLPARSSVQ